MPQIRQINIILPLFNQDLKSDDNIFLESCGT